MLLDSFENKKRSVNSFKDEGTTRAMIARTRTGRLFRPAHHFAARSFSVNAAKLAVNEVCRNHSVMHKQRMRAFLSLD